METIKEITIKEQNYRICKLSAKSGSWLLMQLMGKMIKIMEELANTGSPNPEVNNVLEQDKNKAEESAHAAIQFMLMNLEEDTFAKVQNHALSVCYRLENAGSVPVPMPVIMNDGRFAIKELEFDIETVMSLTSQSLFANLAPFFSKNGLMKLAMG
jgi:hypothetical protein